MSVAASTASNTIHFLLIALKEEEKGKGKVGGNQRVAAARQGHRKAQVQWQEVCRFEEI